MFRGRNLIIAALAAFSLSACAETIETRSTFDPAEVAFINARGPATIEGQIVARQLGGGVVTCAATEVFLIPASTFAIERITAIYGSAQGGRRDAFRGGVDMSNVPPLYTQMTRSTNCDAQGNFRFEGLAPGDYFVQGQAVWFVPGSIIPEGAAFARRVRVTGSGTHRVIMS